MRDPTSMCACVCVCVDPLLRTTNDLERNASFGGPVLFGNDRYRVGTQGRECLPIPGRTGIAIQTIGWLSLCFGVSIFVGTGQDKLNGSSGTTTGHGVKGEFHIVTYVGTIHDIGLVNFLGLGIPHVNLYDLTCRRIVCGVRWGWNR